MAKLKKSLQATGRRRNCHQNSVTLSPVGARREGETGIVVPLLTFQPTADRAGQPSAFLSLERGLANPGP